MKIETTQQSNLLSNLLLTLKFTTAEGREKSLLTSLSIPCTYGIFTYMHHKNQPNVGKSTIHGWYGLDTCKNSGKNCREQRFPEFLKLQQYIFPKVGGP